MYSTTSTSSCSDMVFCRSAGIRETLLLMISSISPLEITLSIDKVISKGEIEEIIKSSVSLMPADLQKTMSEQELVDVVEYITTLKKVGA